MISLQFSLLYQGNFIVNFFIIQCILIIEHVINHASQGAVAASKQTSTMPGVAARWLQLAIGHIGAGGNFIFRCSRVGYTHLGCFGTPGGAVAGAKSFENGFHQSYFPIRQVVPLGIPQATGLIWLSFS